MVGSGFDICFTIVALMFLCTIFALDSLEQRHQHHRNHQNHPKHLLHDFVGYQDWNRKLIHIDELTADAISSILDSELHQNTMYVLIKTPTNQTIEVVTAELDKFVVSRPWWMVELEPYSWHIQSHEQNSIWDIVLLRIPSEHLEIFKAFAQNNFASPEHCAKLPLIVSNHDGDAWGNRLSNVQSEWDGKSGAIFYVYTSYDGSGQGAVSFAEGGLCPDRVNKWECVFLPMSNCTLPSSITSCRNRDCLPCPWGTEFYTSASAKGDRFPKDRESEFMSELNTNFPPLHAIAKRTECIPLEAMKSTNPLHLIDESTTTRKSVCVHHPASLSFIYGFYLRFNAVFRSRIAHKMFSLRNATVPRFTPDVTCVAAHIRMDDRSIRNTNMIDWCAQCASFRNGEKRFNESCPQLLNIQDSTWMDMGCFSGLPFGAATLDHYINASKVILPSNRNLFILTDDEPWLKPEVDKYRARVMAGSIPKHEAFNIFAYPAGEGHRKASSEATVDFWASIRLAQQCQGFVGHFSSTATLMVYRALCYRHGKHNFLACPPAFDIGAQNLG